ncbi:hypothetical protein DYBT9275_04172 [Dyadobacter sp. CECT 9275]|uniref:Uncharacterized protein n=2 Tax=Dyadobacter helix TaxID=2822344 RepID=A0A916ND14_9BACT|nr:hypothetical protein DYBT9275_04172 [Dyadobacter sp. CECT 9275]
MEVSQKHEVCILGKPEHAEAIRQHLPAQVTFRPILEAKASVWNTFWERIYLLFKKLPKSRSNFFLMELFKVSNVADQVQQQKGRKLLAWIKKLPKFIPYDFYLNRLRYRAGTRIDDIDQFICFTAIADDHFHARLIRERKQIKVYVYSWDHPCKHTCFSKRVTYLCWSQELKKDIVTLQNIPEHQIFVAGASQFGYIHDYLGLLSARRPYSFPYIYFGCAIGIVDLVPEELRLIKLLAECLMQEQPEWKLVVRPYPVLTNWTFYETLKMLPNVVVDDQFRTKDLSVAEDDILKKYETIEHAEAFFHLGTTMGLEACFTETPSFILDFGYTTGQDLSLYNFIHQFQNDRHLIQLSPVNAIRSREELSQVLKETGAPQYKVLNKVVRQQYSLKSFSKFAEDLVEIS